MNSFEMIWDFSIHKVVFESEIRSNTLLTPRFLKHTVYMYLHTFLTIYPHLFNYPRAILLVLVPLKDYLSLNKKHFTFYLSNLIKVDFLIRKILTPPPMEDYSLVI